MKYRKETIIESDILDNKMSAYEIARLVGCDHSYISLLRSGKRVATEAFYQRLLGVLTNK